ncbi:MAG: pyruvate, phosphate dikinase [Anaerolineae bacterium]|jgi:pyruvate,orthophosphate dikinase|nr:pyruvate, phosphate dikinase [Anaerolineae bacterium]
MSNKWVYLFGEVQQAEQAMGSWDGVRGLLGGKGANLADMMRAGLPVPPGFTVTTQACMAYINSGFNLPEGMWEQVLTSLAEVEKEAAKKFGDPSNPLLVSVRSGAKFSMPGMMDTILNVGLNDKVAPGMIALTGNERFVWDSYRRLLAMFGHTAMGINDEAFDHVMETLKAELNVNLDTELKAENLKELVKRFKQVYVQELGREFPQEPLEQLQIAVRAVFDSWMGKRAVDYRRVEHIPDNLGTAVNVVTMVFGNMGDDSGTGVAFTRDPATGQRIIYGDYLLNAQGEDVVAGIRNTKKVADLGDDMPAMAEQLQAIGKKLELHYKDMQDTEFTIERGKLWMLQTRNGKRTARAAVKIAVDMVAEGLITKEQAVMRVTPKDVDFFLHPQFDEKAVKAAKLAGRLLAEGVNASPGAAVGKLAFDANTAEAWGKAGEAVIMIRAETKPDDVHGMVASQGILTSRGGATAHAAVVARQFGIPAVVGAAALHIDQDLRQVTVAGRTLKEGDIVSLDGATGQVYEGTLPKVDPDFTKEVELATLLGWADEISANPGTRSWESALTGFPERGLQVWTNADYPKDARRARDFGAKGIGLCRTEHMFFEQERLPHVQDMILNAEEAQKLLNVVSRYERILETGKEEGQAIKEQRREEIEAELEKARTNVEESQAVKVYRSSLDFLLPYQRSDFYGLFEAMDGLPVIIRLIDPPLHEFLPTLETLLVEVTDLEADLDLPRTGTGKQLVEKTLAEKRKMLEAVERMHESNPMMGLRGIRLGIIFPDIMKMQVRAIFEAACDAAAAGYAVHPEVMIPLTGHVNELKLTQAELEKVARQVMTEKGREISYKFGTMMEIPRACVTADEVAGLAEFFSFGTNDLTQMTFGYSRDDAERRFLVEYVEQGILPVNPFQTLDAEGVGALLRMGVRKGRAARQGLEVGICGEHGGDPESVEFCYLAGLNYVSCSPFRVPVARLAAAQSAIKHRGKLLD